MPGPKPTPSAGPISQNIKTIALLSVIAVLAGVVIYLLAR